eukprot:CAMPEP_0119116042 /NCGR_PEP_ID=MMETSP1180-20130426/52070_1 /TAXON_ID=3052 ORGANISM="Chlamydomonas cf sp, Strain CCMP681" /NCGR_SAMPLE_ID=MMETSP1180 /ASSEMBLY_ACC=CAM_ASM_000741 /LENGTH=82 /DNA_ID=CAMNT_0007105157 /DNA_START=96 /DNA_END=345 /DNA_ORIENTATION=-
MAAPLLFIAAEPVPVNSLPMQPASQLVVLTDTLLCAAAIILNVSVDAAEAADFTAAVADATSGRAVAVPQQPQQADSSGEVP